MHDENALISIIIPVYNTKPFLRRCLDSVLDQSYKNIQIILVDDGSTDGAGIICDEYSILDKRVEVIHQENGGLVRARKAGLKEARGAFVGFVDSDDYVDKEMFSSLYNTIQRTNADFVHSGFVKVHGDNQKEYVNFISGIYDLSQDDSRLQFLKEYVLDLRSENSITYSIWSKLFCADLIKKCYESLNDEQQFGEDALCFIRCIFESKKIALDSRAFYYYRIQSQSLSHMECKSLFVKQVKLCGDVIRILEEYMDEGALLHEKFEFLVSSLLPITKNDKERKFKLEQFKLPDVEIFRGKRNLIYGAGNVGEDIYDQLKREQINVVGISDRNEEYRSKYGLLYFTPESVNKIEVDNILIAVYEEDLACEIKKYLIDQNISEKIIIWVKPVKLF